jgi:thiol-activated cytolysin
MKTSILTSAFIFLFVGLLSAQFQIKNPQTGKMISLRKIGTVLNKTAKSTAPQVLVAPITVGQVAQPSGKSSSLKRNIAPQDASTATVGSNKDRGCTTQRIRATVGMRDMALFTASNEKIHPFSIIDGSTILSGAYVTKNNKRNPIVLYSDLPVSNPADASIVVDDPSAANIQRAVRTLSQKPLAGSQTGRINFSSSEVTSKEEMKMRLNVHTDGFWASSIDNSFEYSSSKSDFTLMAEFEQLYFSINVNDLPANPKDIFSEDIGAIPNDLVYVSSVTYGRKAVLLIKLTNTTQEIVNKLKVAISAGLRKATIDADLELSKAVQRSEISGYVFGGNANDAVGVALNGTVEQKIQALNTYMANGARFNANNPGAPLYYTLNFVNDNATCGVFQTLDQNVQKCSNSFVFEVTAKSIKGVNPVDSDKEDDLYGCVGVKIDPPMAYADGNSGEKEIWRIVYPERKGSNLGARFITVRSGQTVDLGAGNSKIIRRIVVPRDKNGNIQSNSICRVLTAGAIKVDAEVPASRNGNRELYDWNPHSDDARFVAANEVVIDFKDVLAAKTKTYQQTFKHGGASHIMTYEAKYIEE